MSTDSNEGTRPLAAHANLRHLKDQAKDLVKSGVAATLSDAQFKLARLYGFPSWPKLRARVVLMEEAQAALETNDAERLRALVDGHVTQLMRSGAATSLPDAQAQTAQLSGATSWDELVARLDKLKKRGPVLPDSAEVRRLARAIEADDFERVRALMTRQPALHRAPIGYGRNGPLTCVAECDLPPTQHSWPSRDG